MDSRKFKWAVFTAAFFGTTLLKADLPPPYDSVELRAFNPEGFYNNPSALEQLFHKHTPKIVIEVGCWLGQSTRHMASLLPPGGKLYAVDHWLGSVEHQRGQKFWTPLLPFLYEQFLSNVIHDQLTHVIIPMRMSSIEASEQLADLKADLIYIDAGHDSASVYADLNAWFPKVKGHGILCGDDWGYPDVCRAVIKFADEQNLTIGTLYPCLWYFCEQSEPQGS